MKDWEKKSEEKQKIGDIFKTFGPYLILYAEYIKDFEKGLPLIQDLYSKNHKLSSLKVRTAALRIYIETT